MDGVQIIQNNKFYLIRATKAMLRLEKVEMILGRVR